MIDFDVSFGKGSQRAAVLAGEVLVPAVCRATKFEATSASVISGSVS